MSNATERVTEMETVTAVPEVNGEVRKSGAGEVAPGTPEYEISITPIDFDATIGSKLISTLKLGEIVNSVFRPYFKDYVGCNIQFTTLRVPMNNATGMNGFVDPMQQHIVGYVDVPRFEVELYFQSFAGKSRENDGSYKNIVERGKEFTESKASNLSNELAAKIARMNSKTNPGKNYTLSKETKDMLDKFYLPFYRKLEQVEYTKTIVDPKTGDPKQIKEKTKVSKPDWEGKLIYELTDNSVMNPNMSGTYLKVTNLDLVTILREVFGNKNELGHQVDYQVTAIRPLNTYGNMMPVNTLNALLKIDRLDCVEVDTLYRSLGMMTVIGNLPINRA